MTNLLHPSAVLYAGSRPFPHLAACEHFAGSEKLLKKALQIQAELSVNEQPIFDITADCEDGAPAGKEQEHATMIAELLQSGEYNVTEPALEVGYQSLSHFSAAFHETFGCCPGLYPLRLPARENR